MREKKIESHKEKKTSKDKEKKKKASVCAHSPMRLAALFNGIMEHEILEKIITLYIDFDEVEKATIKEAIVKYIFF